MNCFNTVHWSPTKNLCVVHDSSNKILLINPFISQRPLIKLNFSHIKNILISGEFDFPFVYY